MLWVLTAHELRFPFLLQGDIDVWASAGPEMMGLFVVVGPWSCCCKRQNQQEGQQQKKGWGGDSSSHLTRDKPRRQGFAGSAPTERQPPGPSDPSGEAC